MPGCIPQEDSLYFSADMQMQEEYCHMFSHFALDLRTHVHFSLLNRSNTTFTEV